MSYVTRESVLYCLAFVLSILVSSYVSVHQDIINLDGICYLLSAEKLGQAGLSPAMQLCGQARWPFYSLLIFFLSDLSHLSLQSSARVANAIFIAASVVIFMCIVKRLGASVRIIAWSGFVIILAHPLLAVQAYIIRDHGFWCFYLASIFFLLGFINKPSWANAVLWSVSLLLAALFRVEGLIYLLLVPLSIFFLQQATWKQRCIYFLKLNLLLFTGAIVLFAWVGLKDMALTDLSRLGEVLLQFKHAWFMAMQRFLQTADILQQHIIPSDGKINGYFVLALLIPIWYSVLVLQHLSWIYVFLVGYGLLNSLLRWERRYTIIIISYMLVALLISSTFFAEHFFLSQRYLMAGTLILMLCVPFALDHLMQAQSMLKKSLFVATLLVLLVYGYLGLTRAQHTKMYVHEAGVWLASHIPSTARLYSNDLQLMYYSKHFGLGIFDDFALHQQIAGNQLAILKQYDYVAVRFNYREKEKLTKIEQILAQPPLHIFSNARGDGVWIYRVLHE